TRSSLRISPDCHRSGTSTSTCSAATHLRCLIRSPEANSGRCAIREQPGSTRREQACVGFLFRCYSNPFYGRWGFADLPFDPRRAMIVRMVDLARSFGELTPNAETVEAMKAARRGELSTPEAPETLLQSLKKRD